jgi:N-acetylglucosaminyl-diphospho-decaprenol L-rhamnosyltransferase
MDPGSGPGRPRLAVVTVLYRSAEMLAKTGPTWAASAKGQPVEFVFVDNSPGDGSESVIGECFADVPHRYRPDPGNPGFAGGCNRALELVTADHVLLLNADVWLSDDSLARILAAIEEAPEAPLAVGLAMHGRDYAGIDLNPISLFIDRAADAGRGPLGPSGGAAVFPVALLRRFGGFHEEFFAWGEDADLAFRLYAAGVRTRALNLSLPHAWGHSVEGDRKLGRRRAFLLARNRVLVAARTFSGPLLLTALPVMVLGHGALALRRVRQGTLVPFLAGVAQGLRGAPRARRGWTGDRFGIGSLLRYRSRKGP